MFLCLYSKNSPECSFIEFREDKRRRIENHCKRLQCWIGIGCSMSKDVDSEQMLTLYYLVKLYRFYSKCRWCIYIYLQADLNYWNHRIYKCQIIECPLYLQWNCIFAYLVVTSSVQTGSGSTLINIDFTINTLYSWYANWNFEILVFKYWQYENIVIAISGNPPHSYPLAFE